MSFSQRIYSQQMWLNYVAVTNNPIIINLPKKKKKRNCFSLIVHAHWGSPAILFQVLLHCGIHAKRTTSIMASLQRKGTWALHEMILKAFTLLCLYHIWPDSTGQNKSRSQSLKSMCSKNIFSFHNEVLLVT